MTPQAIPLRPFSPQDPPGGLCLVASACREGGLLRVAFRLEGRLPVVVPAAAPGAGSRRDGLWNGTCFEAFVAVAGEPRYTEVNLSPARDWNVYLFDGYRSGMRPDAALPDLPRTTEASDGILAAAFDLPLASLAPGDRALEVGLAAVIRFDDGNIEHWALAHPGDRPDFHLREGLLLRC